MEQVKRGVVDIDKASRITKLAGQINESFYAEVKVKRTYQELGGETKNLGQLTIGE